MRYASAGAFRAALEARLKAQHTAAVGLSRLRKRVVFERLLARLAEVAPDAWCLKGGFSLELRLGEGARATKDVDIDWTLNADRATELLLDAAALELDDWFVFDVRREVVDRELTGGGQRWVARADLAGREFERVVIDVGFELPPVVSPSSIVTSRLLDFAGVEPVVVPALAVEQHLAEKLHAYTRTYAGGRPSSRVKDLVDIVMMLRTTAIDGDCLMVAVESIFERRGTHAIPRMFPEPPSDWTRPWATLVEHLPADADLAVGVAAAAAFWSPVLAGAARGLAWNPSDSAWRHDNKMAQSGCSEA